jgi:hypothetical protein
MLFMSRARPHRKPSRIRAERVHVPRFGIHRDHVHVIQEQERFFDESRPLSRTTRLVCLSGPLVPALARVRSAPAPPQQRRSLEVSAGGSPMRCAHTAATNPACFRRRPVRLSGRQRTRDRRIDSSLIFLRYVDSTGQVRRTIRLITRPQPDHTGALVRGFHRVPSRFEIGQTCVARNTANTGHIRPAIQIAHGLR